MEFHIEMAYYIKCTVVIFILTQMSKLMKPKLLLTLNREVSEERVIFHTTFIITFLFSPMFCACGIKFFNRFDETKKIIFCFSL